MTNIFSLVMCEHRDCHILQLNQRFLATLAKDGDENGGKKCPFPGPNVVWLSGDGLRLKSGHLSCSECEYDVSFEVEMPNQMVLFRQDK